MENSINLNNWKSHKKYNDKISLSCFCWKIFFVHEIRVGFFLNVSLKSIFSLIQNIFFPFSKTNLSSSKEIRLTFQPKFYFVCLQADFDDIYPEISPIFSNLQKTKGIDRQGILDS